MAARYPGVIDEDDEAFSFDRGTVERQLSTLGFTPHQIGKAITCLTQPFSKSPSPYLSSLLALPPLEACLSYLLVHIPETDLPAQFLRQQRASEAFVRHTDRHSIQNLDISVRWLAERASKEGGWPEKTVADVMALSSVSLDWGLLIERLNRRLVGIPEDDLAGAFNSEDVDQSGERDAKRKDEAEALAAVYPSVSVVAPFSDTEPSNADIGSLRKANTREILIPLESAPEVVLHIVLPPSHPYPSPGTRAPPIYITSPTQPPYIRLHLLAAILRHLTPNSGSDLWALLEAGEGIVFTILPIVEEAWLSISANGPPDVADVMAYLSPRHATSGESHSGTRTKIQNGLRTERKEASQGDDRDDGAVKREWDTIKESEIYKAMLESRMKLPAWDSREEIVSLLEKSRVLLCVGETGARQRIALL